MTEEKDTGAPPTGLEPEGPIPYRLTVTERIALKDILRRKQEHEAGLMAANRDFKAFLSEKGLDPDGTYTVMQDEMAVLEMPRRKAP